MSICILRKFGESVTAGNVVLVSFYNQKSLGLKYLESALTLQGYRVTTVFFKKYNSINPKEATDAELDLLKKLMSDIAPVFVGFSVMTSLYLETVFAAAEKLRNGLSFPLVMGGVYPTMFHELCLEYADFVVVGEGEEAIVELAEAIKTKSRYDDIQNLAFRKDGKIQKNEIRNLLVDMDEANIGLSASNHGNKHIIENDRITSIDPHSGWLAFVYEVSCSRGCPYSCSYCCNINMKRLSKGKGPFVRFRDVDKVIEELLAAKKYMKNLRFIRFWDEIFGGDEAWVDGFVSRYKKEIGLPFGVWGHPLWTKEKVISKLKKAGLYQIMVGIQSGSPYIRKEIFHRTETQEDIIEASKVLAGVPQVGYDFILRHLFETQETMLETFELVQKLTPPFELQLHSLNFIPGTDISQKAIDMNVVSKEDMQVMMYAPMKEQYNKWWNSENNDPSINHVYNLIYLSQFSFYRKKLNKLQKPNEANLRIVKKYCVWGRKFARLRHYYRKGMIVLRGIFS